LNFVIREKVVNYNNTPGRIGDNRLGRVEGGIPLAADDIKEVKVVLAYLVAQLGWVSIELFELGQHQV
jgi:hypothetical protein